MTAAEVAFNAATHLATYGVGAWVGWRMFARAKRPVRSKPPINVVNGLVLPMQDDPRWERSIDCDGDFRYHCGPVEVWFLVSRGCVGTVVDRAAVAGGIPYGLAVVSAFNERLERETRARQSSALDEFMGTSC